MKLTSEQPHAINALCRITHRIKPLNLTYTEQLHTEFKAILQTVIINLLKPTGYVMHNQFNIQQLHALPTLYLCVLYLSENKQRLVPLTA